MNTSHEKSFQLMVEYLDSIDDEKFLSDYLEGEGYVGPTIDEFCKSFSINIGGKNFYVADNLVLPLLSINSIQSVDFTKNNSDFELVSVNDNTFSVAA